LHWKRRRRVLSCPFVNISGSSVNAEAFEEQNPAENENYGYKIVVNGARYYVEYSIKEKQQSRYA
jgi:hypothetical protein